MAKQIGTDRTQGIRPMILIAKNQSPPYFTATRDDLVSVVLPSEKEMSSIIKSAGNFFHSGPGWRLAVLYDFVDNLMLLLVQKTIVALGKLVASTES